MYENQEFYFYDGDNNWKYTKVPKKGVKGQWTQKVFQVDDSPRYEGSGSWVHLDGKSFWENTTDAPLPRRELSVRDDYNILKRGNRHEITNFGWVHDQNNEKIIRKIGEKDYVIAREKGYNTYRRVDNKRCEAASNWWQQNNNKWAIVRSQWDDIFSRNQSLTLKKQVDNKSLFMYLFSDEFKDKESIKLIIDSFVTR